MDFFTGIAGTGTEGDSQISQWVYIAAAGLAILAGAMNCFFGYRIFRLLLAMWGLILGAVAGVMLGMMDGRVVWIVVGGILGGVVGIFLMLLLYYVAIFLLGAYVGALGGVVLSAWLRFAPPNWMSAVGALAGGILAIFFQKMLIILGTAFVGAANVAWGIFTLAGRRFDITQESLNNQQSLRQTIETNWDVLITWCAISAAGIIIQYFLSPKKRPAS